MLGEMQWNLIAYLEIEGELDLVSKVGIVKSIDDSIGQITRCFQYWDVNTYQS